MLIVIHRLNYLLFVARVVSDLILFICIGNKSLDAILTN